MLIDSRQSQQTSLAADAPALDLKLADGHLMLTHQNIKQIDVRYYLMDIELFFSRNPFVQQDGRASIAIQPNHKEVIPLGETNGKREISHSGATLQSQRGCRSQRRSSLSKPDSSYANSMELTLVDAFGQLQVRSPDGRPIEKAYVKVYSRGADGQVKFYKDGYTDLRGQWDYASLSTNDLQSVQRFAILVLHPEHGALIREAAPPKR